MKNLYRAHKKSIDQVLAFCACLAVVYIFFKFFLGLVSPFILAFLLSRILYVPVNYITKKSFIPRTLVTIFAMLMLLTFLGLIIFFGSRRLIEQLLSFSVSFPYAFNRALIMFKNIEQSYYNLFELFEFFPNEARDFIDKTIITMLPQVVSTIGVGVKDFSMTFVKALPSLFVFILMTIIATFFMTKDADRIKFFFSRQIPENISGVAVILKKDIFGALLGYIRAQLILMSFSGIISIIGLTVLGYPYALLFGLLVALIDSLPIFGPGFILWPWMLLKIMAGELNFAFGLLMIYFCIIICRQFLEPKVLSSQIGVYPLVTLGSMYAGLKLLGPLGLICGPVLVIVIKSLQNADLLPKWKTT